MSPELMRNLDYRQLHTLWTVAKEVSVTCASAELFLAQPTVSGQLGELELAVGTQLVASSGRRTVQWRVAVDHQGPRRTRHTS